MRIRRFALATACIASCVLAGTAVAQSGWPRDVPPPAHGDYDFGGAPSPELARTIGLVCTALPVGAGAVTWAVQGETSVTSWVLIYFGSVEGPAIGYHYAGFHTAAARGASLRGGIALATLIIALDRKTDGDREAVLAAGAAVNTGLALYDVFRLPDRMSTVHYGARLQAGPALCAGRVVPAVHLRF